MFKLAILLFVFVALALSASAAKSLLITLPDGKVQGAAYTTILNNVTYYGWRGIPFAAPPIGKLRFEAPQPPQPWTGVLNVTTDGKSCLNLIKLDFDTQSEDCLFINVYVPSVTTTDKLSVMFWIYGGGFQGGSGEKSSFGPDYLIEENVIIVTHNYRVGPMDFLSTGDTAIRGNAGLKDQVLAMQWTKNNICLFGGDPEKITIFGESAGGQSVGLHLVSKKSAGLFRAAIVQSGSGLTNSSATLNPEIYTFRLANLIPGGSYGNSTKKLAEFLRNCTANEIYTAANLITGQDIDAWPVVEVGGKDAFLTDSPYVLYESGNFNQVPAMMGICAEEGLMEKESAQEMAIMLDADPTVLIPLDLRPENESDKERIAAIIKSIYLQDGVTFASNLTGVIKFQSDNRFARALIKNAELASKYVPVYVYQFAYSINPTSVDGVESAGHGAEVPYLFYSTFNPLLRYSEDNSTHLLVQNRMVKLWTNFVKYLNPTPEESELLQNVTWTTISPTNIAYLNINATLAMRYNLKGNIYKEWNNVFYSYGTKPFITF